MSTLVVTPTYINGSVLTETDLDSSLKTPIEAHFNNANVEGSDIQSEALTGSNKIRNTAITADKIAANAITTIKLEDAVSSSTGILTAKIANDAVTTAKILNQNITTDKINNLAVTSAKIADNSVPKSIMPDLPRAAAALTNTTINWSLGVSAGPTIVGSVTITGLTSGKPVLISLESNTTEYDKGYIEAIATVNTTFASSGGYVHLYKDGSKIATHEIGSSYIKGINPTAYLRLPLSCITHIDTASSSSHTYSIYLESKSRHGSASYTANMTINSAQLKVIQVV